jgi:hypothetical protein
VNKTEAIETLTTFEANCSRNYIVAVIMPTGAQGASHQIKTLRLGNSRSFAQFAESPLSKIIAPEGGRNAPSHPEKPSD